LIKELDVGCAFVPVNGDQICYALKNTYSVRFSQPTQDSQPTGKFGPFGYNTYPGDSGKISFAYQ
jgi:hypothetical protein